MLDAVVAGHLCLDLIPSLPAEVSLTPGALSEVGAMTVAPGGGVANVGIALSKLGAKVKLMGKVGADPLGRVLTERLTQFDSSITDMLLRAEEGSTSYTIVINPQGADRTFWHHPGCNATYLAGDVELETAARAKLFYFGYPPLMKGIYADGGAALAKLFRQVKARGATTVLDMSTPDAAGEAGRVDWRAFLEQVLPFVDIFMPNLEETRFMLERGSFKGGWRDKDLSADSLYTLSGHLLEFGPAMAGLKLGAHGLYLRTASAERLTTSGRAAPAPAIWSRRELWAPVLQVAPQGATGAGDATLAGFLASLLRGLEPTESLAMATAVGACSVEAADASSGILSWEETKARLEGGWPRAGENLPADWQPGAFGVFRGPHDARAYPNAP